MDFLRLSFFYPLSGETMYEICLLAWPHTCDREKNLLYLSKSTNTSIMLLSSAGGREWTWTIGWYMGDTIDRSLVHCRDDKQAPSAFSRHHLCAFSVSMCLWSASREVSKLNQIASRCLFKRLSWVVRSGVRRYDEVQAQQPFHSASDRPSVCTVS